MSYDIYYTIRKNVKTKHEIETLFFGKKIVFDYEKIEGTEIFNKWEDAVNYVYKHHLQNCHIRRHISTSGYYDHTDYMKGQGYWKNW